MNKTYEVEVDVNITGVVTVKVDAPTQLHAERMAEDSIDWTDALNNELSIECDVIDSTECKD